MLIHPLVDNLSSLNIQTRLNLSKAIKSHIDCRCDNQPPREIICSIVRNKETGYIPNNDKG